MSEFYDYFGNTTRIPMTPTNSDQQNYILSSIKEHTNKPTAIVDEQIPPHPKLCNLNFQSNLIIVLSVVGGFIFWPICIFCLTIGFDFAKNIEFYQNHKTKVHLIFIFSCLGILVGIVEWILLYIYFYLK
jgi:hypothetical protein